MKPCAITATGMALQSVTLVAQVFHQYAPRAPGRRDGLVKSLPEAEHAANEVLSIPVHRGICDAQLHHIAEMVAELVSSLD